MPLSWVTQKGIIASKMMTAEAIAADFPEHFLCAGRHFTCVISAHPLDAVRLESLPPLGRRGN